jgi:hypothetical protein
METSSHPVLKKNVFSYSIPMKVRDVMAVLRGLWLLLLFDLVALFAFLKAPQGTDVLMSIAEDLAYSFKHLTSWGPLFWLLITLLFWSIAAEFCSRFIIYLTDNSGRSLAPQRVEFRKSTQKYISRFSLFFPMVLMIFAFLQALSSNSKDFNTAEIKTAFIIIIVLILFEILLVYRLYIGNQIVNLSRKYKRWQWLAISPEENVWVRKLYGILNDLRVELPLADTSYTGNDLPRDTILTNGMFLPSKFISYTDNPIIDEKAKLKIWMFKVPTSFYNCLLRQLRVLAIIATIIIISFAFLVPSKVYMTFGATAMICMAFACWQIIYTLLHFLDKAQTKFPIRFFLLIMFLVTSFYNRDHPVRTLTEANSPLPLPLNQHFDKWLDHLKRDTTYRIGVKKDTIPVVFIASEGGALRTGAFAAMVLAKLADSFPSFSKYIYGYSGVSGGALGVNFFNALRINKLATADTISYSSATQSFFKKDFLAAVTGKLVFGEIINYFIPWHIKRLDRAIALEKAWEYGVEKINKDKNILASSFNQTIDSTLPAVFINTTEVETGLQCIWSNVNINGLPLSGRTNLYSRINQNLAYSTAINLSTRFPLISPGAAFFYGDKKNVQRYHFVDGGYYENAGSETLLEVMENLQLNNRPVKPYVIQFNFGTEDSIISAKSIKSFSEIMEVVAGIYNTRSGRSNIARYNMQQFLKAIHGEYINLNLKLSTKQIPLNWILSKTAVNRLSDLIEKMVYKKEGEINDKRELQKLFIYK